MGQKIIYLAMAGGAGTLARYFLSSLIEKSAGSGFPWGTLFVNGVGCLVFGLVWSLAEHEVWFSPEQRLIFLVGFLGAFTTFSTFAFDTALMVREFQWWAVLGNLLLQNTLGLVCAFLGMALARVLLSLST